jgi:cytochrome oxidase Cu insertion factor (SCO1/SenC/PrrC family)
MKQIIQNYSLGLNADEVVTLYKDATKKKFDFLKISVDERNDNKRFSHNFTGFYKINDDSDSDEEK